MHQNDIAVDEYAAHVLGTFTMHMIHSEKSPDPLQGPYLHVPEAKGMVKRTYPLLSFRDQIFKESRLKSLEEGRTFLQKHGFSAFDHTTTIEDLSELENSEHFRSLYYSEVQDLVQTVTGCKKTFVTSSVIRGGQQNSKAHQIENKDEVVGQDSVPPKDKVDLEEHEKAGKRMEGTENLRPYHLPTTISPSRIPHMDYTPLGARRLIRSMRSDIYQYASTETGVIAHEDAVCISAGTSADGADGDAVLWENYNQPSQLGPRYAIFSVWRPLKLCTQDPLAFIHRSELGLGTRDDQGDLELWKYTLRTPGFKGDWLWDLAMVRGKASPYGEYEPEKAASGLKWFYLPDQRPDEVLFIKHFDSASLGANAPESPGVPHGSPDLGDAGYGEPRESIEARVIAFW